MASVPPVNGGLPLLFNDLAPLSSVDHATWKIKQADTAPFLAKVQGGNAPEGAQEATPRRGETQSLFFFQDRQS